MQSRASQEPGVAIGHSTISDVVYCKGCSPLPGNQECRLFEATGPGRSRARLRLSEGRRGDTERHGPSVGIRQQIPGEAGVVCAPSAMWLRVFLSSPVR
jgi:hypothetical protein